MTISLSIGRNQLFSLEAPHLGALVIATKIAPVTRRSDQEHIAAFWRARNRA
jgi:hypothetical protein